MPHPRRSKTSRPVAKEVASHPRIIGGELRGRTIPYSGDTGLRPMKDRVRESLFNLLGPRVVGKLVLDLFAGTGALAIEALSRKAARAILVERSFPNAKIITQTAATLGLTERVTVIPGDAFRWLQNHPPKDPAAWLVFLSPPYDFWLTRQNDMFALITNLWQAAPPHSVLVAEFDQRLSPELLPGGNVWQVRPYPPAVLAISEKGRQNE